MRETTIDTLDGPQTTVGLMVVSARLVVGHPSRSCVSIDQIVVSEHTIGWSMFAIAVRKGVLYSPE